MPEFYQVGYVDDPEKTSIHVFVSEDAPFNDETDGPQIREFHDGTSSTIGLVFPILRA